MAVDTTRCIRISLLALIPASGGNSESSTLLFTVFLKTKKWDCLMGFALDLFWLFILLLAYGRYNYLSKAEDFLLHTRKGQARRTGSSDLSINR